MEQKRPTLAFATMCKNEEHCIRQTLDAAAPYMDYLVVCDTGSTDRTIEIVEQFMEETGIPGEVHQHEWIGFDKNKTMMMNAVYGKTDYVLHLDADDMVQGDFSFTAEDAGRDAYYMTMRRGGTSGMSWKATVVYNNQIHWRFIGTAHTIIRSPERPNGFSTGDLSDRGYCLCDGIGSRAFDPKKYFYDAERLEKQFWETVYNDPDGLNSRSVFYCAQSWMDYGKPEEALKWYSLYTRLKQTWNEEVFEAHMRIAICMTSLNYSVEAVVHQMEKAIRMFPDRAEPRYHIGLFLNRNSQHELAYKYLKEATECSFEDASRKYALFVIQNKYGKYLNDELAVACYWTGRYEEGLELINEIIEDPEFEDQRSRLEENRGHFLNKIKEHAAG